MRKNRIFHMEKYIDFSILKKQKKLKLEEQAAIIIMSEKGTIEGKIEDLQKLINDYGSGEQQICEDIKNVIQLWKDILEKRFCQEGVVFLADLQERGQETDHLPSYRFFSTYQRALEFLIKEKEYDRISKDLGNIETYAEIWRMELDSDDPEFDVYCFDHQMNLNKIICCSDKAEKISMRCFENMYDRLYEETN